MNNKNVQKASNWILKALFFVITTSLSCGLFAAPAGDALPLPAAPGLKMTLADTSSVKTQDAAPAVKLEKANKSTKQNKTANTKTANTKPASAKAADKKINLADKSSDQNSNAGDSANAGNGENAESNSNSDTNTDDTTAADSNAESDSPSEPVPDDAFSPQVNDKDSLEGFNRAMFTFNDKIDIYFLKPIATLYNKIMPKPLNKGIHNVYDNINTVPTIINDLLQANFYQAANDTWRLGVNSTVGIAGLFDIAERMQLEPYSNDFGLTLARWGYANSTYLVLPFFGPNTIRDGIFGLPVDYFAFSVYPYINPPSTRYQVYALGVIDRRAQLLKLQEVLDEASYDKYVFLKNAYMQRRAYQIEQNDHRSCCDRRADAATEVASPAPSTDENYDD